VAELKRKFSYLYVWVRPQHPTGTYRRSGYIFQAKSSLAFPEELLTDAMQDDPWLVISPMPLRDGKLDVIHYLPGYGPNGPDPEAHGTDGLPASVAEAVAGSTAAVPAQKPAYPPPADEKLGDKPSKATNGSAAAREKAAAKKAAAKSDGKRASRSAASTANRGRALSRAVAEADATAETATAEPAETEGGDEQFTDSAVE